MCARAIVAGALTVVLAVAGASGGVTHIEDVPAYLWYNGCGPTATGMIVGYWDAHGFDDLIEGSGDWSTNRQQIQSAIASAGHIRDYVPTPDRVATPADPYHTDDSLADFLHCSRDPLGYGLSYESLQAPGMTGYAQWREYPFATAGLTYYNGVWDMLVEQIDAGRPVELFVDTTGNGTANHFITAVGYDDDPVQPRYACLDTYDQIVHWYDMVPIRVDQPYGVRSGMWFDPGPQPAGPADLDRNGEVQPADIDLLFDAIGSATPPTSDRFDLVTDGAIDWADAEQLVTNIIGTSFADTNLDYTINALDLGNLANRYGRTGGFGDGDSNGDGIIGILDLGVLAADYGMVYAPPTQAGQSVPEPSVMVWLLSGALMAVALRRRPGRHPWR